MWLIFQTSNISAAFVGTLTCCGVGIGNAKNAGLLAAGIIASSGDEVQVSITAKLDKFQVDMRQTAIDKGDALKAQLKNLAT